MKPQELKAALDRQIEVAHELNYDRALGAEEMLELLWPVIEAVENLRGPNKKFEDLIALEKAADALRAKVSN